MDAQESQGEAFPAPEQRSPMAMDLKVHRVPWKWISLAGIVVLLAVLYVAASRYQPFSLRLTWGSSTRTSISKEVSASLQTSLTNTGPFGVSVLALQPTVYADPPIAVRPLMLCLHVVKRARTCGQDSQGLVTGNQFQPFSLSGGGSMSLAWQYSFSCRPHSDGSYTSGPVEVNVIYRFAWFTHSVTLLVNAAETSGGSACQFPLTADG
jgi:hypothetical protein